MPLLPLRPVHVPPDTQAIYDAWLKAIDRSLDDPSCDRNELCREILTAIYFPHHRDMEGAAAGSPAEGVGALGAPVSLLHLDPRNVTLEPEYYHETDVEQYARVKPLLWLWEMFDRSPLGENTALGIPFRRILARRIFRSCGRNFKAFPYVRFTFGYNMEVGDDVVVHRHVLLDDRGGIRMGHGSSVSDFANIYSHSHDIVDPKEVSTPLTVIGEGVRITYHATILAGVHVADDSMVGAMALATRDTIPHTVHVGVPARPVKTKPERERAPGRPDPLASE
jgi:acetyltransferase-like isoleucine patch superfamily enzyme